MKGRTVAWSGVVVEARRGFGEDFVENGLLLVDMDEPYGTTVADVAFGVPPSKLAGLGPGEPVSFTGEIRAYELSGGNLLLKLKVKEIEQ